MSDPHSDSYIISAAFEGPRDTDPDSSRAPKVSAIITSSSVEPGQMERGSLSDPKYRFKAKWSTPAIDSPEYERAVKALALTLEGVASNREAARGLCDQKDEKWDWGWEACTWVDTLVSVAEQLSAPLKVSITVENPQALKAMGLKVGHRETADEPGDAQAAGAWASTDMVSQAVKECSRPDPSHKISLRSEDLIIPPSENSAGPEEEGVYTVLSEVVYGFDPAVHVRLEPADFDLSEPEFRPRRTELWALISCLTHIGCCRR